MIVVQFAILVFIVYLCIFSLTNRICRCIEYCKKAESYTKMIEVAEKEKENTEDVK